MSGHFRTIGRRFFRRAVRGGILSLAFALAASGREPARELPPAVETPAPPAGITYRTTLDHTAVWVGDQFHYLITVDYTPQYEFVLDNLNQQNVNMDPSP